jgi:5-methyltetrahydrofolate--homocysteine methyltransferase
MATLKTLSEYVEEGRAPEAKALAQRLLGENFSADAIIQDGIVTALDSIGAKYEAFQVFVPELMVAGLAAQEVLAVLRPKMTQGPLHRLRGTIVIGTVQGDVHDVGKNIVAMMLEGGGFKVIDLGVDVPPERFVKEVQYQEADILALSALYSPTRLAMRDTLAALAAAGLRDKVKVIVGGAPIDQDFCDLIGADGYAPDAPRALKLAKAVVDTRVASPSLQAS